MNNEQQGAAVAAAAAAAAPTTARWRLVAALAFMLMLAVLLVALGCQRRQEPVFEVLAAPAAEEAKVYVTGEVAQPGVYPIAPGERVVDVVARAGGLNPEADTLRINLAIRLQDEMHVHISTRPSTPEGQPEAPSPALRPTSVPRSRAAAGGGRRARRRPRPHDESISTRRQSPSWKPCRASASSPLARLWSTARCMVLIGRSMRCVRQEWAAALLRRAAPHLAFERARGF